MLKVAVTGGVACGKSLVGASLAKAGLPVCDTDHLAHELMARGSPVYRRVREAFGEGILGAGGEIDRPALGDIVFADPPKLQALNAIVHPEVRKAWKEWMRAVGGPAAVVIIPLLYEVGDESHWNVVVCVASPWREQRARLRERGISESKARAIIASQMPVEEKMRRADCVIFNCGTLSLLEEQTERVRKRILEN